MDDPAKREVCKVTIYYRLEYENASYIVPAEDYRTLKQDYLTYLGDESQNGTVFSHYKAKEDKEAKDWLLCEEVIDFRDILRISAVLEMVLVSNEEVQNA